MNETIEGTAVEVPESRALVAQPGNALVARQNDQGPADMIGMATHLATALKDIVDAQKLYANISGKKFPTVEAWMTIGRMDNVVAREAERPIRNEDGSYEGFVELVRLSDGMVIGRASALCGTPDDKPWATRGEPARRSMAVTRATSRAFRQQYSWIMALAGYQPTPAEEMVDDRPPVESADPAPVNGEQEEMLGRVSRRGIIRKGSADAYKLTPSKGPEGWQFGFRLEIDGDKNIPQVVMAGPVGNAVFTSIGEQPEKLLGTVAKVSGLLYNVRGSKGSWYRLYADRFENDYVLEPASTTCTCPHPIDARRPHDLGCPSAPLTADEPVLPEPPEDVPLLAEAPTAPLFDDVA